MVVVEYLGGVPGRPAGAPVAVTVRAGALRFKQGGFLRGWSCHLPLATIAAAELWTARALDAAGRRPSGARARPDEAGAYLLAIEARPAGDAAAIVLGGPPAALEALRQEILRGRMRAAKQWRP